MTISVCICTRDRPRSLSQALDSLTRLRAPAAAWDVLVVDNSSSGETADAALAFSGRLDIRIEPESPAGLARARNAALRCAAGDYLVFIDDDVTAPEDWLSAYAEGFRRYGEAAFFGGPIVPQVDNPADRESVELVKETMPGALTFLDPDLAEGPIANGVGILPWGANMAFRRSALEGRCFDTDLGRRPEAPADSGEETELIYDLLAAGLTGAWLPGARVNHHVGADRCSERYLTEYCHGIGRLSGRRAVREGREIREKAVARLRAEIRSLRWAKRMTPPWANARRRMEALRDLALREGYLAGVAEPARQRVNG